MKERKVLTKQIPIKHNRHGVLKTVLLMSVGLGVATLFNKITNDPRKNFSVKKI